MGQATEDAMVNYMRALEAWVGSSQATNEALLNYITALEKRVEALEARFDRPGGVDNSYSVLRPGEGNAS